LILDRARADKTRPWAANAIELALVSGQRREDIVAMQFSQVKDGFLWVEQTKGKEGSKAKLKIPVSLRLDALGVSLEEVIRRCRDSVVSNNVIHLTRRKGGVVLGNAPGVGTVSQAFARLRDEVGIMPSKGKTPCSFHEIRSLAARLYTEEQGPEFAQALLGHKSSKMTSVYRDLRGREWAEIKFASA
jgi:integrase